MKKWIMLLILCTLLTSHCVLAEPQQHFQRSSVIQSILCFDHAVYCSEADGIFRVDLADGSTAYYAYSQPVDQLTLFEHDGRLTAIAKADGSIGLCHISFEGESAALNPYCTVSSFPSGDQWIEAIAGTGTYSVFTIQKNWTETSAWLLNANTGEIQCISDSFTDGFSICTTMNGNILAQRYSLSDSADAQYGMVDTETGAFSLLDTPREALSCMAADTQTGTLYGLNGSEIRRISKGVSETVATNPYERCNRSGEYADGYFIARGFNEFSILPASDTSMDSEILRFYSCSESFPESVSQLNAEGIAVVQTGDVNMISKLVDMLLTGDTSIDVFIVEADMDVFRAAVSRNYALPLDSSAVLTAAFNQMDESIRAQFSDRDGRAVAIPVSITYNLLTVNTDALGRMGLSAQDIPTNWLAFLNWLDGMEEIMRQNGITLYSESVSADQARNRLLTQLLRDYEAAPESDLLLCLQALENLDMTALGQEQSPTSDASESEKDTLLYASASSMRLEDLMVAANGEYPYPLCLSLNEPMLKGKARVAFINPNTQKPENAIRFLEALWSNASEGVKYCANSSLTDPVEREGYAATVSNYQSEIDIIKSKLETAAEIDRPILTEQIADLETYLAEAENDRWAIDAQKLNWLRSRGRIILSQQSWLFDAWTGEPSAVIQQYQSGVLTAQQFAEKLQQMWNMLIAER